jgi:hypothetical protein
MKVLDKNINPESQNHKFIFNINMLKTVKKNSIFFKNYNRTTETNKVKFESEKGGESGKKSLVSY